MKRKQLKSLLKKKEKKRRKEWQQKVLKVYKYFEVEHDDQLCIRSVYVFGRKIKRERNTAVVQII